MGGRKPARMRCGECEFCLREDCGQCIQCVQKKKFGGTGTSKQACMHRRCINLQDRPTKSAAVVSSSTSGAAYNMGPARTSSSSRAASSSHTKMWSTSSNANMSVATSATTSRDNHNSSSTMTATMSPLFPLLPVMACPVSSSAKAPPGTATTTATATSTTTTAASTPSTAAAAVLKVLAKTTPHHLPTMTHMYGRAIPVLEKKDVCAGCGGARDEEAELEPILLCDGKGCGCEFHLKCCIPPLRKVPEGSFYCYDCSEEGTTTLLRQYFEEHDERRLEYPDPQSFLEALWAQDFEKDDDDDDEEEGDAHENDHGEDDNNSKGQEDHENDDKAAATKAKSSSSSRKKGATSTPATSNTTATTTTSKSKKRKRKPNVRLPASELAQAVAFHASALSPMPRMKQHQLDHLIPATSPQDRIAVTDDDDNDTNNKTINNIVLTPTRRLMIGKPVKLFCSFADGYHTGRIVSVRRGTLWTSPRNHQADTHGTSAATEDDEEEEDESTDEYLIRFQAGLEGRKTALHWWVCLEEHSLAVATTLVWCDFGNKNGYKGFKPGRLWLRTSRELIPLRHVLREDQGHVVYIEPSNKNSKTTSTSASRRSSSSTAAAANKKIAKLSLTQYIGEFGDEGFKLLHLQTEATDLFSPVLAALMAPLLQPPPQPASTPPAASKPSKSSRSSSRGSGKATATEGTSPAGAAAPAATTTTATATPDVTPTWIRVRELEYAQACAEWEEQQRVFEWFHRPVENPAFEKALSCLDEPSLGPLYLLPAGSASSSKGDETTTTTTKNKGGMIAMTMDLNRYHADLAPSIPRGLDRNYVMKLLERSCNVKGSKDVAASLSCETVVSIPAALQAMRDERRERHSLNLQEVAT